LLKAHTKKTDLLAVRLEPEIRNCKSGPLPIELTWPPLREMDPRYAQPDEPLNKLNGAYRKDILLTVANQMNKSSCASSKTLLPICLTQFVNSVGIHMVMCDHLSMDNGIIYFWSTAIKIKLPVD